MPGWSHPAEIADDVVIFRKISLAMLGLVTWEMIILLPSDWSMISLERKAHWPSFFYLCCRYFLLAGVISVNIATNVTSEIDCRSLRAFIQFAGVMSMGSASTLLMLRTIAVWNRATFITVPLIVASLGQWGILFHGIVAVRSKRSHAVNACVDHAGPLVFVESMYLYTMLFDFIVLVLTTIGLAMSPRRSSLWQLLFRQGIIYFLIAFVANLIPTMFFLLNLNTMMNRMFTLPGVAAASIVSCRLFISLNTFQQQNVYVNAARPQPPIRLHHAAISSGVVKQARTGVGDDNNNQKRTMGNTIAGIAFRIMSEGVDSMGEVHSMDGPNAATTTSAVLDLKPTYDFKKTSESGEVVVHIETTMHGSDGAPGENHANSTDLEKGESLSHGSASGQNSFESGVAV